MSLELSDTRGRLEALVQRLTTDVSTESAARAAAERRAGCLRCVPEFIRVLMCVCVYAFSCVCMCVCVCVCVWVCPYLHICAYVYCTRAYVC